MVVYILHGNIISLLITVYSATYRILETDEILSIHEELLCASKISEKSSHAVTYLSLF